MPLRRLCLCGLCMCLLLTVAFAGGRSPPPQEATVLAGGDCYKTVTGVPRSCAGHTITDYCCGQLACVGESTCASALRGVCPYPEKNLPCPPHQLDHVYDRHG
ncbi:hypothetical protein VPH35_063510 [Triticum aestivum]